MWICEFCGETVEDDTWGTCWSCLHDKGVVATTPPPLSSTVATISPIVYNTSISDSGEVLVLSSAPIKGCIYLLCYIADHDKWFPTSLASRSLINDIVLFRGIIHGITHDNMLFTIDIETTEATPYGFCGNPDVKSSNSLLMTQDILVTYSSDGHVSMWSHGFRERLRHWQTNSIIGRAICADEEIVACAVFPVRDGVAHPAIAIFTHAGQLIKQVEVSSLRLHMWHRRIVSAGQNIIIYSRDTCDYQAVDLNIGDDDCVLAIASNDVTIFFGCKSGKLGALKIQDGCPPSLHMVAGPMGNAVKKIGVREEKLIITYANDAMYIADPALTQFSEIVPCCSNQTYNIEMNAHSMEISDLTGTAFPRMVMHDDRRSIIKFAGSRNIADLFRLMMNGLIGS